MWWLSLNITYTVRNIPISVVGRTDTVLTYTSLRLESLILSRWGTDGKFPQIYSILADLLFIFSAEKVKNTSLEMVGFQPPLAAMQLFWGHCQSTLDSIGEVLCISRIRCHSAQPFWAYACEYKTENKGLLNPLVRNYTEWLNHKQCFVKTIISKSFTAGVRKNWGNYLWNR